MSLFSRNSIPKPKTCRITLIIDICCSNFQILPLKITNESRILALHNYVGIRNS